MTAIKTEYFITRKDTNEHGNTLENTMGIEDFLSSLNKPSEVKVHKATQDFHAKTGHTVYAHAGDEGFTIFIPDPVQGQYSLVELAQVEGTGTVHVKTESNKDVKIGGSDNYVLKGIGKGVRLLSNGSDYVEF